MTANRSVVQCGNCSTILAEGASIPIENQRTCPECGSQKRSASIAVRSNMFSKVIMKASQGGKGKGKPFLEQIIGDELQHKTNTWMKKKRVIDAGNDWYSEIVQHPETGPSFIGAKSHCRSIADMDQQKPKRKIELFVSP
jgi:hypothetical protein